MGWGMEERASNACGMASKVCNCPLGGVRFFFQSKKERTKEKCFF
jgi:hypothetical protein